MRWPLVFARMVLLSYVGVALLCHQWTQPGEGDGGPSQGTRGCQEACRMEKEPQATEPLSVDLGGGRPEHLRGRPPSQAVRGWGHWAENWEVALGS